MTMDDENGGEYGEEHAEGHSDVQTLRLPPLSSSKLRCRDSRSHDPKNRGTEWYWRLSKSLPELWIRNADELDRTKVAALEKAWQRYDDLGISGPGDGAGRGARKWQNRAALKEEYGKLDAKKRYAMEVALARYEHFVIDGKTGKLDYHEKELDGKKGPKTRNKSGETACLVM